MPARHQRRRAGNQHDRLRVVDDDGRACDLVSGMKAVEEEDGRVGDAAELGEEGGLTSDDGKVYPDRWHDKNSTTHLFKVHAMRPVGALLAYARDLPFSTQPAHLVVHVLAEVVEGRADAADLGKSG